MADLSGGRSSNDHSNRGIEFCFGLAALFAVPVARDPWLSSHVD